MIFIEVFKTLCFFRSIFVSIDQHEVVKRVGVFCFLSLDQLLIIFFCISHFYMDIRRIAVSILEQSTGISFQK